MERSGRLRRGPGDPRPALEVHEGVAPVLPGGVLARGWSLGCAGPAAMSLATSLTAAAVAGGSWLAVIGVPTFGVDAATELGVSPSRTVVVRADRPRDWAERVAAAVDGIDVVLTAIPAGVADGVRRSVLQRARARGAVLVTVPSAFAHLDVTMAGAGAAGAAGVDVVLHTEVRGWHGVGDGAGRLLGRRVVVTTTGRRVPRPVHTELWLPGPDGAPRPVRSPAHERHVGAPDVDRPGEGVVARAASA